MRDFLEEGKGQQVGSNLNLLRLNFSEIVTILPTTVFVHNIKHLWGSFGKPPGSANDINFLKLTMKDWKLSGHTFS